MYIFIVILLLWSFLGADEFCIVVNEQAKITKDPSSSQKVLITPKFGYGFTVAKRYPNKKVRPNRTHVSMEKNKNEIGWVSVKDIICSKNTMTSSPYIEADFIKLANGKKTTLHKKVLIQSSKKYFHKYTSSFVKEQINNPMLYFVYKEENNRYLLSTKNTIFKDNYNSNCIVGWIDKKDCILWDSLVAIEPLDNILEGYIDKSLDKKFRYRKVIYKPLKYYSLRYPLLEENNNFLKILYIKNNNLDGENIVLYIPKNKYQRYKKTLLVKASVVEYWAMAYIKIGKIIAKYRNGKRQQRKLRLSLSRVIEGLTGEEIHAYDNISNFLEKRMRTNHKSILNLTFIDWIDKIMKNRNIYNKKMIKLFKEKGVMLQALYMEKIYTNIHLNKNKDIVYTVARDGNGQEKVKKSKFNISLMTDNKSTKQINYNEQWIWVDSKYLP